MQISKCFLIENKINPQSSSVFLSLDFSLKIVHLVINYVEATMMIMTMNTAVIMHPLMFKEPTMKTLRNFSSNQVILLALKERNHLCLNHTLMTDSGYTGAIQRA